MVFGIINCPLRDKLMPYPSRKVAWFRCLTCYSHWHQDSKSFSACWNLISQFKLPARQPYARLAFKLSRLLSPKLLIFGIWQLVAILELSAGHYLSPGGGWFEVLSAKHLVTFSWSPFKNYFIEVFHLINLDKFRDSLLSHFLTHIYTFPCNSLVLLTVIRNAKVLFQSNNDILLVQWSRHMMHQVSWSVWSRYLIRVLSRSFHRRPIKYKERRKLKRDPEGQANL